MNTHPPTDQLINPKKSNNKCSKRNNSNGTNTTLTYPQQTNKFTVLITKFKKQYVLTKATDTKYQEALHMQSNETGIKLKQTIIIETRSHKHTKQLIKHIKLTTNTSNIYKSTILQTTTYIRTSTMVLNGTHIRARSTNPLTKAYHIKQQLYTQASFKHPAVERITPPNAVHDLKTNHTYQTHSRRAT
eukprot:gene3271-2253_t